MDNEEQLDHAIATIALGALLIWWGLAFMIAPITIGMATIGTGLILIGANVARYLKGIPTRISTTEMGLVALVWGTLDHAFALPFGASLAALLIVIGLAVLAPLAARPRTT
jgi:hypothetical protein